MIFVSYSNLTLGLDIPIGGQLEEFLKQYFQPYWDWHSDEISGNECLGKLIVRVGAPNLDPPLDDEPWCVVDGSKGFLSCRGRMRDLVNVRQVELEPSGALVTSQPVARTVEVMGFDEKSLRIPSLRLIEDIFSNALQNRGAIFVHASAVVVDGRAVLFVGNKGAGKTTILAHCLGGFSVSKMANDTVCIWLDNGQPVARGWPTFFKAQAGTLATTPELARDFPFHAKGALDDDVELWSYYEKVALYPGEAAERFHSDIIAQSPLMAIVFSEFSRENIPNLERVSWSSEEAKLDDYLQGVRNPNHPEWLMYEPVDHQLFEAGLRRINLAFDAENVAAYRLFWAPSLDDLLTRLPELRPVNKTLALARTANRDFGRWQPI